MLLNSAPEGYSEFNSENRSALLYKGFLLECCQFVVLLELFGMTAHFQMNFAGGEKPELYETAFKLLSTSGLRQTVRGKSNGAFGSFGSFQWTRAVKALSYLVLLTLRSSPEEHSAPPMLIGGVDSLAASLDYAIDKQPLWLIDMFGLDSFGNPLICRLLRRSNPGRKRPGPVALAVNLNLLPSSSCVIRWDGRLLSSSEEISELMDAIDWNERGWEWLDAGRPEKIALSA